ncbi:hypothetical protein [Butyribacter intestini]|uniref:hypothetical protein n=1 Tax=Butyribacter intestini TaxID=1703332 RepID=UPI0022DEEEE1|nr:hypothetical protein [Butyribacter intestini]
MEVVTREYKVYNFSELSEDAKEKAKQWYLDDDFRPQEFENIYTEDLHYLFNNSDLKMQFSLSYCQGDGLNIYGKLDLMDVFAAIRDTDHSGEQFKQYKDLFSEHEQKTIEAYMEACGREIELPYNRYYCYCVDDRVDFADEWIEILEYCRYKNIQIDTIRKMEKLVGMMFENLSATYEKYGYDYFYNADDEVVNEACEANGWRFLEDGTFFAE